MYGKKEIELRGFILIKPEAIQRNLVGKILCFIEDKGFKLVGLKMLTPTKNQIQKLYAEHKDSLHYEKLIHLSSNGPVIAIAIQSPLGIDSAELVKDLQGKHDIAGTIRFYFSSHPSRGVIHCSSPGEGLKESLIFFSETEISHYQKVLDEWVVSTQNITESYENYKDGELENTKAIIN